MNKFLLPTEFEGCTVNYGSSFFPINLWPKCKAHRPWIKGGNQRSVTYSMDWGNKCVSDGFRNDFYIQGIAENFWHLESKTSQFEIVVKWLVSCYQDLIHNFEVKESFKFLLKLRKLRTLGNESQNILATKTALNFSRLYSRIHPLKWSNTAGVLTERYIEDITRWREDMNFMFEWQEQYLTSECSEQMKYYSCHENITFISSS